MDIAVNGIVTTMVAGRYGPPDSDGSTKPPASPPSEAPAENPPPPASPGLDKPADPQPVASSGSEPLLMTPPVSPPTDSILKEEVDSIQILDCPLPEEASDNPSEEVGRMVGKLSADWTRLTGGKYDYPRMTLGISGFVGGRRLSVDLPQNEVTLVRGVTFGIEGLKSNSQAAAPEARLIYLGWAGGAASLERSPDVALLASTGYGLVQEFDSSNDRANTLNSSAVYVGLDLYFLLLHGSVKVWESFPEEGKFHWPSLVLATGATF